MLILPVLPYPHINPVLVSLGPFVVRWYALAYIVGIIAGWFYARAMIVSRKAWGGYSPITVAQMDDFRLWVTLGIIVGGRIGYVLFYNFPHFSAAPGRDFRIVERRHVVPRRLAWLRRRHHGVRAPAVAARSCRLATSRPPSAPIGLFLGRIANFINGELWGRADRRALGDDLPQRRPDTAPPSQLYEAALEGIVLLIVLAVLVRLGALKRPGLIIGSVTDRLRSCAHHWRIFPRARRAARISLGRAHHGHVVVHPAHPCRRRRTRGRVLAPTDCKTWLMTIRRWNAKSAV